MVRRRHRVAVAALMSVSGLALVVAGAPPAAAVACSVEQLTHHDSTASVLGNMDLSGNGQVLAVSASALLDGMPNPGNNEELYVIDLAAETTTRLTNTSSGFNQSPSLDDAGDTLVFASAANLDGSNSDGNQEIWRWQAPSTITAVTSAAPPAQAALPRISGDGTTVVYQSTADGNSEIYRHTIGGPGPDQQLTTTTGVSSSFATINDSATRVAYHSNVDGNDEVYLRRLTGTQSTTQVTTAASGSSFGAAISGDGLRISFSSDRNFGGGNADGSFEVFQYVIASAVTTRLTSGPAPSAAHIARSDQTGRRVTFVDDRDLAGDNAGDQFELFVSDLAGATGVTQVTESTTGDVGTGSDLDDTGTRLAFTSTGDLVGENPNGRQEVFVATCGPIGPTFTDVPPSNSFYDEIEWMVETGVASGFPGARFKPLDAVKRQQMANFLYNLAGEPPFKVPAEPTYVDVPATNPFFTQIEWMTEEGIAAGFPGGRFKPLDAVKRQQMANFLYNLAGQPAFTPPGTPTFTDVPTSSPFYAAVEWMAAEEIAAGFPGGRFKPLDPVKRQQMANFVFNFVSCCEVDV